MNNGLLISIQLIWGLSKTSWQVTPAFIGRKIIMINPKQVNFCFDQPGLKLSENVSHHITSIYCVFPTHATKHIIENKLNMVCYKKPRHKQD